MVRALSATRIDLSGNAHNKAGAVKLAASQYENNVPLIKAMIQEIDNRQLISAGGAPTQPSGLEGYYVSAFDGAVTDPNGYEASPMMSEAVRTIDNAQNSTGFGAQVGSFVTSAALAVINPGVGAAHALATAGLDSFGGTPLEKLRDRLQNNLNTYEEIRVAAATKMGAQYGGTKDGGDMDAPRLEDPTFGKYSMANNAPKTPQPMMGMMPAPSMA